MMNAVDWVRGSDLALTCTWKDSTGAPVNMSGMTLAPFEVTPAALAANITASVTNGPLGIFSVGIPWNANVPAGTGYLVSFRIKPNNGLPLEELIPVVLK